tara:strand:+ start:487 stop:1182 length:696 start_codon:yes stop_codon:yes gene_type:complete
MKNFYYAPKGDIDVKFEDIMTPCHSKTPSWWKDMGFYLKGAKSVLDLWTGLDQTKKQEVEAFTTVRACPGFRDLFRNSHLVKFPCDLLFETKADGGYTWKTPSSENILGVYSHNSAQMVSPVSDKYLIIKFELPFFMSGKGIRLVYMDPIYYKDQPFKVCPGVVQLQSSNKGLGFNILTFFEKKDATYHFEQGDPLCLIYFPERVTVKENPQMREFIKKKFVLEYGKNLNV